MTFKEQIQAGIPKELPRKKAPNSAYSHAPKRKQILSQDEKNWR